MLLVQQKRSTRARNIQPSTLQEDKNLIKTIKRPTQSPCLELLAKPYHYHFKPASNETTAIMLCFITALIASASLAAALPSGSIPSHTVEPTSTAAPPISFEAAKQIFEHNNLPSSPQVVPYLLDIHFTPRPTSTAVPPKPTVVVATSSSGSNNTQSSPPGIPKSGVIQVQPTENIPLSSVLGQNQSHPVSHAPRDLSPRQACQNYPYCCPDPRYLNENTAFPYNIIGRFWNNGIGCTGTLVGPRHVLTASHCISCKFPFNLLSCARFNRAIRFPPLLVPRALAHPSSH